jgi:succinyl-CoA synthetase alpha subunit
MIGEIGGEA